MLIDRFISKARTVSARRTPPTPGERVMTTLFPNQSLGYPGAWSYQDRAKQTAHFVSWAYAAINVNASLVGQHTPNLAWVSHDEQAGDPRRDVRKWYSMGMGLSGDSPRAVMSPKLAGTPGTHLASATRTGHGTYPGYSRYKAYSTVKPHEALEPLAGDHPLRRLLDNPNPYDTTYALLYELIMFLKLTGTAYLWCVPDAFGVPCELWVLPSHWVWPRTGAGAYADPSQARLISYYEIRPYGAGVSGAGLLRIPKEEVIAFRYPSPLSQIGGWSKLTAVSMWLDTQESMDKSAWAQMQNQGLPSCFIELAENYDDPNDDMMARLEAKFMEKLGGEYNVGRPLFGKAGMKITPLSFSPESMMYPTMGDSYRDRILAAFGMPPSALGISAGMTYGSILATLAQVCSFVVNPDFTMLGQQLTKDLCPRFQRVGTGDAHLLGGKDYGYLREGSGKRRILTDAEYFRALPSQRANTDFESGELDAAIRLWWDDCLDEQTECLTAEGWKRHDELTEDTRVACYDPGTQTLVYRKPTRIIRRRHVGNLHMWQGGRLDAAMTPNHRVHVQPRPKANRAVRDWEFRPADSLAPTQDYRVLRAAPAACDDPAGIEVARYAGYHQGQPAGTETIDPQLWLEFLGYYISEGCLQRGRKDDKGAWLIYISQADDNVNYPAMRSCVKRMPVGNWKVRAKTDRRHPGKKYTQFVCTDHGLYDHLLLHCGKGSLNKKVPDYVKAWPAADLRVLLDALIAGDGSRPKVNASTGVWSSRYVTVSKQLADDVMEVAVKCGLSAYILHRPSTNPNHLPSYYVNMTSQAVTTVGPGHRSVVPYDGLVWCLEVPTGAFVVRRGGVAHITGNCTPPDPQQVNADIAQDVQTLAISINEVRAIRGRAPWADPLADNPWVNTPNGWVPIPLEVRDKQALVALAALMEPIAKLGQEQSTHSRDSLDKPGGELGPDGQPIGGAPADANHPTDEAGAAEGAETAGDGGAPEQSMDHTISAPNGKPHKQLTKAATDDTPDTIPQVTSGPIAAGLAVVADDTGRVLLMQRQLDPDDPNSGTWEFPSGRRNQ